VSVVDERGNERHGSARRRMNVAVEDGRAIVVNTQQADYLDDEKVELRFPDFADAYDVRVRF
jgi:hypothetical protein